jgi:glycosyltransferase involved in cell wall biosynthesis
MFLMEDFGGGTGNHVCGLARSWPDSDWKVIVVTQTAPQVHEVPSTIDLHVLTRVGWYDRFPLTQLRRFAYIWRLSRRVRPDILHAYFFWSIVYGRLVRLLSTGRVLIENREDMGFNWSGWMYAVLRATRRVPDMVICVADAVRENVLRREGLVPQKVRVIRNGIIAPGRPSREERVQARRAFGFTDEQVVVGMVANLPRAVKGGAILLDAVRVVVQRAPQVRFLLVGVGTDSTTLATELDSRGIGDLVVTAGYQRNPRACYAAMDVSVLVSSSEGLSITLLESMGVGLPTVVTRVGGNPELVVDGETGYLVPLGNREAFVDRIVELAGDERKREVMGLAGFRRVQQVFAIDKVAQQYASAYETVIDRCARSY